MIRNYVYDIQNEFIDKLKSIGISITPDALEDLLKIFDKLPRNLGHVSGGKGKGEFDAFLEGKASLSSVSISSTDTIGNQSIGSAEKTTERGR